MNSLIERPLLKSKVRECVYRVYYDHRTPFRVALLTLKPGFVKELSMIFMVSLTDSSAL